MGEGLEQIDPSLFESNIEQLVDHLLGPGPERFHHPGRERLGHQAAEPGVVGRVAEQEGAHGHHGRGHRVVGQLGAEPPGHAVEVDVGPVRADPAVPQDAQAVGVAGEDPEAHLVAMGRRPIPELGVERVGVARPAGVERVEDRSLIGDGGCGLHCGPTYRPVSVRRAAGRRVAPRPAPGIA